MMRLLSLLDDKELRTTAQLAERLDSTPELVEAMLERCEMLGYVKKTVMSSSCGSECSKCKGCKGFKSGSEICFWEKL